MGIGKKLTKGMIGGGVNVAHKSKMSNAAKNQMSFPGGMPGPGQYGSSDNNVVGRGMAQYIAGESVGMRKMGKHYGPEKALVGAQQNLPEGLKAKIEAAPEPKQSRADKTKMKAKKAKIAADKANDGSSNASLDKMNKTKAKAERLAKRQKRQEGRAERKNIRKKAKQGKIIEGESGEYNAMSKKQKIKASRQKQNKSGPGKHGHKKKKAVGPMKTDPAKTKKSSKEVVVSGDKSKVSKKTTGMSTAEKKAEMKRRIEFKKKVNEAKRDSKKEESAQMREVQKDKRANEKVQRQRKSEGKDYVKYKKGTSKDGGAKESVVVRKKLTKGKKQRDEAASRKQKALKE